MRITWIRAAAAAVAVLAAVSVQAADAVPARLDSLQVRLEGRLSLPAGGNSKLTEAVLRACINEAQASVCEDFNAYAVLDTLVMYPDSLGAPLPSDFLRIKGVSRIIAGIGDEGGILLPLDPLAAGDSGWAAVKMVEELRLDPQDQFGPRRYYLSGGRLLLHPRYDMPTATDTALYLVDYFALAPLVTVDTDSVAIDAKYRDELLDKAAELAATIRENWTVAEHWLRSYERKVGLYGIREPVMPEKERQ
jgi:hypothetical protein